MPERQCRSCKHQEEWGCYARQTGTDPETGYPVYKNAAWLPVNIDGEEVYACPRQHFRENPVFWDRLLFFYGFYGKGHLPDQGSISQQSASLLRMFAILDDVNEQCDAEVHDGLTSKGNR